jgi:hypothetical protein
LPAGNVLKVVDAIQAGPHLIVIPLLLWLAIGADSRGLVRVLDRQSA